MYFITHLLSLCSQVSDHLYRQHFICFVLMQYDLGLSVGNAYNSADGILNRPVRVIFCQGIAPLTVDCLARCVVRGPRKWSLEMVGLKHPLSFCSLSSCLSGNTLLNKFSFFVGRMWTITLSMWHWHPTTGTPALSSVKGARLAAGRRWGGSLVSHQPVTSLLNSFWSHQPVTSLLVQRR